MMRRTARLALLALTILAAGCSFDSAKTAAVRTVASIIFNRATTQSFSSEGVAASAATRAAAPKPASRLCALRCKLKGGSKPTRAKAEASVVTEMHVSSTPRRTADV